MISEAQVLRQSKNNVNQDQQQVQDKKKVNDLFSNITIKCKSSKPAVKYCNQLECYAFACICSDEGCQCNISHEKCVYSANIDRLHKKINSKLIDITQQIKQQLDKKINQIIDTVSDTSDKIYKNLKTFGLNKSQQNLVRSIREVSKQTQNINKPQLANNNKLIGNSFYYFRKNYNKSQETWFEDSLKNYQNLIKDAKIEINYLFEQLLKNINCFHAKYYQNYQLYSEKLIHYFNYSNIIQFKDPKNVEKKTVINDNYHTLLKKLGDELEFNKVKQIFSFSNKIKKYSNEMTSDFIKNCKEKQNLLFLLQTNKNKKFCVFIPKSFNTTFKQWTQDLQGIGFIYSITDNILQIISNKKCSVLFSKNQNCLYIGDAFLTQQRSNKNGIKIKFKEPFFGGNITTLQLQVCFCKVSLNSTVGNSNSTINIDYQFINGTNTNSPFNFGQNIQITSIQVYQLSRQVFQQEHIQQKLQKSQQQPTLSNQTSLFKQQNTGGGLFGNNSISVNSLFGNTSVLHLNPNSSNTPSIFGTKNKNSLFG